MECDDGQSFVMDSDDVAVKLLISEGCPTG